MRLRQGGMKFRGIRPGTVIGFPSLLMRCRVLHIGVKNFSLSVLIVSNEKIDGVVMANRGKIGNFSFGSITERVVKHSPVPVNVIPTEK